MTLKVPGTHNVNDFFVIIYTIETLHENTLRILWIKVVIFEMFKHCKNKTKDL